MNKRSVINAMSYNIWGGPPKNSTNIYTAHNNPESIVTTEVEVRAPKVNALLNGEDIDVAGFQEVSANTRWVRWLRANLDEKYGMVAAHTFDIKSGVYIIYRKERFEVLDNGIFWLAEGAPITPAKLEDGDFQRICNWTLFRVKATGEVFVFMDTHLAAGLSTTASSDATPSKVRSAQTRILVSQIPVIRENVKEKFGIEDCPFILVGDMNTIMGTEEYNNLAGALDDSIFISKGATEDPSLATFTNFFYRESGGEVQKGQRIDFIFVSKQNISVLNYKMVQTSTNLSPYGAYSSDHNAVVAQLELDVKGRVDTGAKRYYEDSLGIPKLETKGFYSWNVLDCGSDMKSFFADKDLNAKEFCVSGVTGGEVEAYSQKLIANGYAKTWETDGAYVRFVAFYDGEKRVILCYEFTNDVLRIIIDPNGVTPEEFSYSMEATPNESAELYQYGLEQLHKYTENGVATGYYRANGMAYVVKCADNSVIIIDGGHSTQMIGENGDYAPANRFNDFLHKITGIPSDEKIRISCWYLTHCHDDHYFGFSEFIKRHYDKYELERVLVNIPSIYDPIWLPFEIEWFNENVVELINEKYPNCKHYTPHSGDIVYIADVKMQILLTHEDSVDPITGKTRIVKLDDTSVFNDTSTVVKMWLGEMTAVITGDITPLATPKLVEMHGESLKIDIIQAAHHGGNLTVEMYDAAKAKYVLVAMNHKNVIYNKYFQDRFFAFSKYSYREYYAGSYDMTVGLAYRDGKIVEVWPPVKYVDLKEILKAQTGNVC